MGLAQSEPDLSSAVTSTDSCHRLVVHAAQKQEQRPPGVATTQQTAYRLRQQRAKSPPPVKPV
jgi:hypothetical protein